MAGARCAGCGRQKVKALVDTPAARAEAGPRLYTSNADPRFQRLRQLMEGATGAVTGRHYKRRRVEFLDFMNRVVAQHAGREIHVILDNLSTHKPKRDRWLQRHPNVHFHYTPTHASWLNQIEIWFSILAGQSLNGGWFGSVRQLVNHIDAFIASYNAAARPFVWTRSAVHRKRLKPCFAV